MLNKQGNLLAYYVFASIFLVFFCILFYIIIYIFFVQVEIFSSFFLSLCQSLFTIFKGEMLVIFCNMYSKYRRCLINCGKYMAEFFCPENSFKLLSSEYITYNFLLELLRTDFLGSDVTYNHFIFLVEVFVKISNFKTK